MCLHEPDLKCLDDLPCMCNLFTALLKMKVELQETMEGIGERGAIVEMDLQAAKVIVPQHVPVEFIQVMEAIFEEGAARPGRAAGAWKDLSRQQAADKSGNLYVHMCANEYAEVACNALILWWHFQRQDPTATLAQGNDDKERP